MPPHSEDHRAYYDDQQQTNREFWRRFGGRPEVDGKRVLDIGCGHGAMSIELAQAGAEVVGVDTDGSRIQWAERNLIENHPQLASRVTFLAQESTELPFDDRFDLAVSKDTLEHVADVDGLLGDLRNRLHHNGELWVGFSPLYFSPWGDHGRAGLRVPWAHALLPRGLVYRAAARISDHPVRDLSDLGLNGLTPAAFRISVAQAAMIVVSISYNRGDNPLLKVMSAARILPALERYMTVSVYAVLAPRPTV